MHTFSRYLAMYFAWTLGVTETWVFLSVDEYWPLSVDDYLAVVLMLWCARIARFQQGVVLLCVSWAFVTGNFYALLFSFEEKNIQTVVQITAISIGLGIAVLGLCTSLIASKRFFRGSQRTI